jgi:hypothetical protein
MMAAQVGGVLEREAVGAVVAVAQEEPVLEMDYLKEGSHHQDSEAQHDSA